MQVSLYDNIIIKVDLIILKVHSSVSLDPDEDPIDPQQFVGLLNFLDNDLSGEERSKFLQKTLPSMAQRAANLKELKPKGGLHFSLQQQRSYLYVPIFSNNTNRYHFIADCTELEYTFVSSLIANAFFSTFPQRTDKSHPTLQNFNFSNFFKHLPDDNVQKSKLKSILYYFEWLDRNDNNSKGCLRILRQVSFRLKWNRVKVIFNNYLVHC